MNSSSSDGITETEIQSEQLIRHIFVKEDRSGCEESMRKVLATRSPAQGIEITFTSESLLSSGLELILAHRASQIFRCLSGLSRSERCDEV